MSDTDPRCIEIFMRKEDAHDATYRIMEALSWDASELDGLITHDVVPINPDGPNGKCVIMHHYLAYIK